MTISRDSFDLRFDDPTYSCMKGKLSLDHHERDNRSEETVGINSQETTGFEVVQLISRYGICLQNHFHIHFNLITFFLDWWKSMETKFLLRWYGLSETG